MPKAPKDRSEATQRTFVPEGGTGVFGGGARTQRTVKFDASNPIHVGIANNRENNPNSHVSYGSKGTISIPMPGEYSEENLPTPKPKRAYDVTGARAPKKGGKKAAAAAPAATEAPAKKAAKKAPAKPDAREVLPDGRLRGQMTAGEKGKIRTGVIKEDVEKRNAAIRAAKLAAERKNNGL